VLLALLGLAFLAAAGMPAAAKPTSNANGGAHITLDFQDADIRAIVKFMSELTGVNYLIDNRVKGTVTIITPSPVTKPEAQQIFESILEVQGYAIVPAGRVQKIVPAVDAKQKGVAVRGVDEAKPPAKTDALVSQLIRLKHVEAAQLVPVLRPLVSPNSYLAAHAPSNTLILTDYASNVRRIVQMVDLLDVPEQGPALQVFAMRYAGADKVAETLNKAFAGEKGQALPTKFLADERTNSVVALVPARLIPQVKKVLVQLDRPPGKDSDYIHVYYLKNADAEGMAKVLTDMLQHLKGGTKEGPAGAGALEGFLRPVSVMADKSTNALVIGADPQDYDTLRSVIEKLDIRRLQVYVEGLVMEITSDLQKEFGVEWRTTNDFTNPNARTSFIGQTAFSNPSNPNNINAAASNPFGLNGLAIGVVDGLITFQGQQFLNLGALVTALQSDTAVNILSTPNLLTMDNEEAEIVVGQNVPFLTGTVPTTNGVTNPFQTVTREDIGLKLRVTPQITTGDSIRLDIYQEISSVVPGTINNPQGLLTNKRSLKTTVVVRQGQMIALGGLIQDQDNDSVNKVPLLGDVPLLGHLFRSTTHERTKTDLMVFLQPTVIRRPQDLETLSRGKYHLLAGQTGQVTGPREAFPAPPKVSVPAPARPAPPPVREVEPQPEDGHRVPTNWGEGARF
jgi:general secretion pathway protein D